MPLSDRFGRIPVYRFGAGVLLVLAFPGWWLLSLGNPLVIILVITVAIGFGVNTMLGSQCALLPELFGNRHRYIGVATTREFSAVLAGGVAPVAGAWLISISGGAWWPVVPSVQGVPEGMTLRPGQRPYLTELVEQAGLYREA